MMHGTGPGGPTGDRALRLGARPTTTSDPRALHTSGRGIGKTERRYLSEESMAKIGQPVVTVEEAPLATTA